MERLADHQLVSRDPDLFLRRNPGGVAIDECQRVPESFPALRVAIDDRRDQLGRFLITGSSSPELPSSISESLAGRVAVIEMAPLAWSEVFPRPGASVVERLVDRTTTPLDLIHGLTQRGTLQQAHEYWFRGGSPEPWLRGIRDFVAERSCRFGIVVNNDTAPRLFDERLVGVPFVFL